MNDGAPFFLPARSRFGALLRGVRIQARVVVALMLREAVARYGHHGLGFFWVIGEPLLLTSGVMFVWSITNMTHGSDVGIIPFALTGYSFLTLWRHIAFKSVMIMRQSTALVFHNQINFFDVFLARCLIETVGVFSALMVAYTPLWLLGYCPTLRDPLVFVGGWLLTAWFSISVGLIIAAASELSESMHQLLGPVMYLTLPLTGAFFMLDWLPPRGQEIMAYSPLVNCVEMFRSGMFPLDYPTHWDADYIVTVSFVVTAIGLPFFIYAQRHVKM